MVAMHVFSTYFYVVNTTDVPDLMKRKFNSIDLRPKYRELIDEIPESAGLARRLLWKEKVERAVERKLADPNFKNKVSHKYTFISYKAMCV